MEEERVVTNDKPTEPERNYVSASEFQELRDRIEKYFETLEQKKSEPVEPVKAVETVEPVKTEEQIDFDTYCYNHFDKRKGE